MSNLEDMRNTSPDIVDKREGPIIRDTLVATAIALDNIDIKTEIFKEQTYLLTATGENLDLRGNDVSVVRLQATRSLRIGRFYGRDGELMDITVGDRFSTQISTAATTGDILIYVATQRLTAGVWILRCETYGVIGNNYTGTILPLFPINLLTRAELTGIHVPARDVEGDDDYRARIKARFGTRAFGGNITGYKEFVGLIDGVGSLKVYPVWDGGGTVKLSVLDSQYNPISDKFKRVIKELVDPEENEQEGYGIAPIGHLVTVTTPNVANVNITANVTLSGVTLGQVEGTILHNIENYMVALRRAWADADNTVIFISNISAQILQVEGVINVFDILINAEPEDLILESGEIPVLEEVFLND